jgi:NADH-quinone oxidoreductase subunit N
VPAGEPDRCLYAATAVGSGLQLAALLGALVTVLLAWPRSATRPAGRAAVTASLVLTATAGATAVAAARDLGTWLVALELATLPIVALVALRGARSAVSGAVALLTTSLVSFAMLALAAALWLAATGRAFFDADAALVAAADPGRRAVLVLAVVLALAGIGFKLSLVPFHAWTPEAYDGARCRSRRSSPAPPRSRRWPPCSSWCRRSPRWGRRCSAPSPASPC